MCVQGRRWSRDSHTSSITSDSSSCWLGTGLRGAYLKLYIVNNTDCGLSHFFFAILNFKLIKTDSVLYSRVGACGKLRCVCAVVKPTALTHYCSDARSPHKPAHPPPVAVVGSGSGCASSHCPSPECCCRFRFAVTAGGSQAFTEPEINQYHKRGKTWVLLSLPRFTDGCHALSFSFGQRFGPGFSSIVFCCCCWREQFQGVSPCALQKSKNDFF